MTRPRSSRNPRTAPEPPDDRLATSVLSLVIGEPPRRSGRRQRGQRPQAISQRTLKPETGTRDVPDATVSGVVHRPPVNTNSISAVPRAREGSGLTSSAVTVL